MGLVKVIIVPSRWAICSKEMWTIWRGSWFYENRVTWRAVFFSLRSFRRNVFGRGWVGYTGEPRLLDNSLSRMCTSCFYYWDPVFLNIFLRPALILITKYNLLVTRRTYLSINAKVAFFKIKPVKGHIKKGSIL